MYRTCALLLLLVISLAAASNPRDLQATSITITASRSTQLASLCKNTDRGSLYSKYGVSGNVQYMTDFSRFFSLDRYGKGDSALSSTNSSTSTCSKLIANFEKMF
jgi:hypothetical protein